MVIIIWQIQSQHPFEKLFKTQSFQCFAHTLPTFWLLLHFGLILSCLVSYGQWLDFPPLLGIRLKVEGHVHAYP